MNRKRGFVKSGSKDYKLLWKQVEVASEKDLTKTQVEWLEKIIKKARFPINIIKFNKNDTKVKTVIAKVCFEYALTKLFLSSKINAKIGINKPSPIKKLRFIIKAAAFALNPAIDFCSLMLLPINSS